MKHSITKKNIVDTSLYSFGVLLILILWEIGSILYQNDVVLPSVFDTFHALYNLLITSATYKIVFFTIIRLVVVIVISFILALVLSVLSFWKTGIKKVISPFVLLLKTLPVASIIIIMLIFIGHENCPYYISFFVIFPIMYEGLLHGLNSIDKEVLEEIKMQSNLNFLIIKDIYFPLIKPNMVTSFLQSFGLGLKVMVMAEFIAQPKYSIGKALLDEKNNFEYAKVFAWTIILVIIVIIFEYGINRYKKSKGFN